MTMTADQIIAHLGLERHPEGGWYRQTWMAEGEGRPAGTAIYFLLKAGGSSDWQRVVAAEVGRFSAGAPLILRVSQADAGPSVAHSLGSDLAAGQAPQVIVPPHHWQAAQTTGAWTLVGCTVSPGFQFTGFHLAPPDFDIS